MLPKASPMTRLPNGWIPAVRSSACGASDSSRNAWRAWKNSPDRVAPGLFPPELVVRVKSLACELPATLGVPLSRWSVAELTRHLRQSGLVAQVSDATLWRWLDQDAIRPWQHRCWIFPRAPDFAVKAGVILDLYERQWQDQPLLEDEFVVSADEKTSVQARRRVHTSLPPQAQKAMKVEHEYERLGAWAYLAAWDVHRAKVFGHCSLKSGIVPFDELVAQVMGQDPYRQARRVFWIVDNGSSHRGEASVQRLQSRYPHLRLVHRGVSS